MKKVLLIAAAMLSMSLVSCKKNNPDLTPSEPAKYKVTSDDEVEFTQTYGKQKTIAFYIQSANGFVVSENVEFTVAVDPTKVAEYNESAEVPAILLPEAAYTISETTLKVYKNNKKSLSADLKVAVGATMEDVTYVLPIDIKSISVASAQKAEESTLYVVVTKEYQEIDKGNGTKATPYLVFTKEDLMDMHEECVDEETAPDGCVYFKLMENIDLEMTQETELDWEPINFSSPYKKKVDFNGNGKTIKNLVSKTYTYASFLGVAYGEIYDVTFENCYIEGSYAIGVVGGYGGTSGIPANATNVKCVNCVVNNVEGTKNGVGGMFGRICEAKISRCSFSGEVKAIRDYTGGIFGYDAGQSKVENCFTSGLLSTTAQRAGAIAGGLIKANSSIKNCVSTMGISSNSLCIGGIVGHTNLDNKNGFQEPNNEISGCIAWNDSLAVRKTTSVQWSSGAIIGFTAPTNVMNTCVRKNGLKLEIDNEEAAEAFKFSNHDGSYNSGNPLPTNCTFASSDPHIAKYDGKEAEAGKTASAIAKSLGYDEAIWDLSGAVPVLK